MEPLLRLTDVKKSFGDIQAIEHVSLDIYKNSVVGLVGGNGAGKTTLLRIMSGVYRPTEGNVTLANNRPVAEMRSVLGVVPESTGLYSKLTAWENIRYHSRLHGIDDQLAWNRTYRFARLLDIEDSLHRYTEGFSRGMKQKTALLRSLAHGPQILLLDEPTGGLDVTSARTVRSGTKIERRRWNGHLFNASSCGSTTGLRPYHYRPQWGNTSRWNAGRTDDTNEFANLGRSICIPDW